MGLDKAYGIKIVEKHKVGGVEKCYRCACDHTKTTTNNVTSTPELVREGSNSHAKKANTCEFATQNRCVRTLY